MQLAIPKAFEQLVCTLFEQVLERVVGPEQHGFRPGHSTVTNLMTFTDGFPVRLFRKKV